MVKKKNKIAKITEEQYLAYVAGLKNEGAALFDADGQMLIPREFTDDEKPEN